MHLKKKARAETKRVSLSLRVAPEIRMFCRHQANASETVEAMIRKSAAFKKWLEINERTS